MLKATIGLWLLASICALQATVSTLSLPGRKSLLSIYKGYIEDATNNIKQNLTYLTSYSVHAKSKLNSFLKLLYNAVRFSFRRKVATKLGDIRITTIGREKCKDVEKCYDDAENKMNIIENTTIYELQECIKVGLDYYDVPVINLKKEGQDILIESTYLFLSCIKGFIIKHSCMARDLISAKRQIDKFGKNFKEFKQENTLFQAAANTCWTCMQDKVKNTTFIITEVMKQSETCMENAAPMLKYK
uniref:Venom protein n=1 Tax=Ampulex compressa TaxID=860918 RepID=A0A1W6EW87_AMPCP|nr:venom protein [Ampulex compressa]